MKTIGEKIKYYRQIKGLSQEELGKGLGGLTKVTVSNWENDKKSVPLKYHKQIAQILGCNIAELSDEHIGWSDTISQEYLTPPEQEKESNEDNKTPQELIAGIKDLELCAPGKVHKVPVLTEAQAKGWDAEFEAITDSIDVEMCETEYFFGDDIEADWVAVRVNGNSMGDELPHGSTVLVDMGTPYPKRGKRVLAKLTTGELVVKRYFRKDNIIRLESDGNGMRWEWNCKTDPSMVQWMRPVKQISIKED